MLYSAGSGVSSVHVVLSVLRSKSLMFICVGCSLTTFLVIFLFVVLVL